MTTKELYGISDKELNGIIGEALMTIPYIIRIAILKQNLNIAIEEEGVASNLVNNIHGAISFWEKLKPKKYTEGEVFGKQIDIFKYL